MTNPTPHTRPEIRLQDGERILREGVPNARLTSANAVAWSLLSLLTMVGAPLVLLAPWAASSWTSWHKWWLTDRRLVVRTGLLAYKIRSVPLDRIVDVTLEATLWERLWGLQSVRVRDMTGEVTQGQVSTALRLAAVDDAAQVADEIIAETPTVATRSGELSEVVSLLQKLVQAA